MNKVWKVAPVLLLAGCWEFAGERGVIGFSSGHTANGQTPWTPDTPVVRDVPLRLEAEERLDGTKTEWTHLEATARGGTLQMTEKGHWLVTPNQATTRLRFHGEAKDRVTIRSRVAHDAQVGWDQPGQATLTVVQGSWAPVGVWVSDATGQHLGYPVEQLEVRCTAPVRCRIDGNLQVMVPEPGQGSLTVGIAGVQRTVDVRSIPADELIGLELYSFGMPTSGLAPDGGRVWGALGRDAQGGPVGGVTPQWLSHPDQTDPLLLSLPNETVTARFQALQTQARPPGSPKVEAATPTR